MIQVCIQVPGRTGWQTWRSGLVVQQSQWHALPPTLTPDDLYQRTSIVVCRLMSVEVCDNVCSLCDNVCSCQLLVSWKELQATNPNRDHIHIVLVLS